MSKTLTMPRPRKARDASSPAVAPAAPTPAPAAPGLSAAELKRKALEAEENAILELMRASAENKAQGDSYVTTLAAKLPTFLTALGDMDMLAKHKKDWRFAYAYTFSVARGVTVDGLIWSEEQARQCWNDKPAKAWPEPLMRGERSASTLISEAFKLAGFNGKTGEALTEEEKAEKAKPVHRADSKPAPDAVKPAPDAVKPAPDAVKPEAQGADVAEIISVRALVTEGERKAKALMQVEKRDKVKQKLAALLSVLHELDEVSRDVPQA